MRKEYISLESKEPTSYQKKFPQAIPLIGKIIEIDGELFGEVLEYQDHDSSLINSNNIDGPPLVN